MKKKIILADLILEGEHLHQDFKYAISDSRKISKSLCAFANTEGGRLLIGVKDNGSVAGVRTDEEYYMIESAAHLYSHPRIEFTTRNWELNGKTVLQVTVAESKRKPHFVKLQDGTLEAYIRIHDENILAPEVLVSVWEKEKQPRGSLIRYSENEQILFNYFENNRHIGLRDFERIARISHIEAIDTLANLTLFGIIELKFIDNEFFFRLKE